jgi:uncharacterized membrane protein
MQTYSLTRKQLVLDRVGVAWSFFCCGSVFGLLLSTRVPTALLSKHSNLVWVFLAVVFGLVYPVMLVLTRLLRRNSGAPHDEASD